MRKFVVVCFLVLTTAVAGFAQKGAVGKIDPAQGVRDAFDRLIEGIKEVNVNKVMGVYEKSPKLLIFNNNGTATQGWDEVKSINEKIYAKLSNVTLDVTGLRVEMLGKTAAFVTCKWKQTQENNGNMEDSSGRMTLVFKIVGKDWKITHRHTSPDASRLVFPSERETEIPK